MTAPIRRARSVAQRTFATEPGVPPKTPQLLAQQGLRPEPLKPRSGVIGCLISRARLSWRCFLQSSSDLRRTREVPEQIEACQYIRLWLTSPDLKFQFVGLSEVASINRIRPSIDDQFVLALGFG